MPTAWAAIPGRLRSNVFIAIAKPSPSSPRRLATGTRMSSKASSAVGLPRIPILCSMRLTEKPGDGTSTTKHDSRRCRGVDASASVTAKTVMRPATEPWVMNRFEPLMT